MRIVVLDGYCINPGDLSWDGLRQFGEVEVFDRTRVDQVAARAAGAEIALVNKTSMPGYVLSQLPELKYIGVVATGYDVVDMDVARERGIVVTNVPTYGTASVAQFVFALLLELCHRVALHADAVRAGEWSHGEDWCFWKTPLVNWRARPWGLSASDESAARPAASPTPWGCG